MEYREEYRSRCDGDRWMVMVRLCTEPDGQGEAQWALHGTGYRCACGRAGDTCKRSGAITQCAKLGRCTGFRMGYSEAQRGPASFAGATA